MAEVTRRAFLFGVASAAALPLVPEAPADRAKALPRVFVVSHRVDALTQAFRVQISERAKKVLLERAKIARVHGRASIGDETGADWELKVPLRGDGKLWRLRREDHVRLQIDLRAPGGHRETIEREEWIEKGITWDPIERKYKPATVLASTGESDVIEHPGWTIEVIWYAQYLAETPLADVIAEGRAIAKRFGVVLEERLRRIDLCADVAGFEIKTADYLNFSRKAHVKLFPYTEKPEGDDGFRNVELRVKEVDLPALCNMYAAGKIAGIRVGCGNAQACVYDKRKHLQDCGGGGKREAEEERWTKGGWDGVSPVARCEFRVSGSVLDEIGARKPDCVDPESGEVVPIDAYIGRIWATFLKWLRLTVPGVTASGEEIAMTRRETDPRWKVLEQIDWKKRACDCPKGRCRCVSAIRRVRVRGGASAAQSLGAMASMVAASGVLRNARGFPLPEAELAYKDDAKEKLLSMLKIVCRFGENVIAGAMIDRWGGAQGAAVHVATVLNAARARFPRAAPTDVSDEVIPWKWYETDGMLKLPWQLKLSPN
jgi:hypothetical protein